MTMTDTNQKPPSALADYWDANGSQLLLEIINADSGTLEDTAKLSYYFGAIACLKLLFHDDFNKLDAASSSDSDAFSPTRAESIQQECVVFLSDYHPTLTPKFDAPATDNSGGQHWEAGGDVLSPASLDEVLELDLWVLWPDNYMCQIEELGDYVADRKGLAYEIVDVTEYDAHDVPIDWIPVRRLPPGDYNKP